MASKPYQDKSWLEKRWYQNTTREEIAKEAGCSPDTITRYARKFGLPHMSKCYPWKDAELLRELYHDEGMTQQEIAEKFGAAKTTISKWMKIHGIETRDRIAQMHMMKPHAEFFTSIEGGYEMVRSESRGRADSTVLHRLIMVAEGEDPYKVFSGNKHHVHHKNGLSWDNRPENLELMSAHDHGKLHHGNENEQ